MLLVNSRMQHSVRFVQSLDDILAGGLIIIDYFAKDWNFGSTLIKSPGCFNDSWHCQFGHWGSFVPNLPPSDNLAGNSWSKKSRVIKYKLKTKA